MGTFHVAVDIGRPPADVFALVADPCDMPRWYDAVDDVAKAGQRGRPAVGSNRARSLMASWMRGPACSRSLGLRGAARRLARTAGQHPVERRVCRGRRVRAAAGRPPVFSSRAGGGWCRQRPLPRTDVSRSRAGPRWVDRGVGGHGPTRVAAAVAASATGRCRHRRRGGDRRQPAHPHRGAAVPSGKRSPGPRGVAHPHGDRDRPVVRTAGGLTRPLTPRHTNSVPGLNGRLLRPYDRSRELRRGSCGCAFESWFAARPT